MPSLSQRYRPQVFADVTGQGHITETLRKEVATGTLGHAYLFSGPRGVGKTTAARIFAKALNCEAPKEGEPCNVCTMCLAANQSRCVDLIELDAATHTGVDTIREAIIEHVRFAPMIGKRKIYVLDEAHMLSASSWNALLKTLEEPPAYAFFILATTEWHKVPATIVSRCQRFEFRRIADDLLFERVKTLAQKESWKLSDDVARLIVSRAEGCVRDAETLLGQLGSLGETDITMDVASLVIPPSRIPLAAHLMLLWASRQHAAALVEAQRLFDEGIPVLPLFDDFVAIIRRLLSVSGDARLAEAWHTGLEEERVMAQLVGKFAPGELNDIALLLFERRRDVKAGVDPLFALQLVGTVVACGLLKHSQNTVQKANNDLPRMEKQPEPTKISPDMPSIEPTVKSEPLSRKEEPTIAANVSDAPVRVDGFDIQAARAKWNALVRAVDEKNHSLPFILKISRPEEVRDDTLVIRFQYPFHLDKIVSDVKHRQIVESCARLVYNMPGLKIDGVVGEDAQAKEQRSNDVVSNILKAFGGSVVES